MTSNLKPPHVKIVGGGFGGLYAARGLADEHVQVTILDKHNYHLFRDTAAVVAPTRNLFGFRKGPQLLPGVAQPAYKRANMLPASSNGGSQDNHRRSRSHIGTKGTLRSSAAALPWPICNRCASPAWWRGSYGSASTFTA